MPLPATISASILLDGQKDLILGCIRGHEEMGRLFEYHVDLFSEAKPLEVSKVLGKAMTVTLRHAERPDFNRSYSGIVCEFHQYGVFDADYSKSQASYNYHYRAVLRPKLWLLTRSTKCRIFQNKTVIEIIKSVLDEHGIFYQDLSGSKGPIQEYCVQYRESDFDFISRLLEQEGLYYFFEAFKAKRVSSTELTVDTDCLFITNSMNSHNAIFKYATIPHVSKGHEESIHEWHCRYEVSPRKYELTDFDFIKVNEIAAAMETATIAAEGTCYDYVADYNNINEPKNLKDYSQVRLEELQTGHEVIHGKSDVLVMSSGMLFIYEGPYDSLKYDKCVVTSVDFLLSTAYFRSGNMPLANIYDTNIVFSAPGDSNASFYENVFTAIPVKQQFRPRRITPVPVISGTQTAMVTGDVDKYGRVKIKFHWETDQASCWIRVSQPMAGNNWGWISLPRAGQEVIVSFEEGNPNRPIITGRVYNGKNMPPYDLPNNKTQSGIKTCSGSSNGSPAHFNELRFEDKQGNEEIYLHAEKDLKCVILNDETREVKNDRTVTIKTGNDSLKVEKGKCIIEAMTSIELKVGSNSIKIDQKGITIKGMTVTVQGEATLDAKSPMTTVNGDGVLTLKGGVTKIN
jgi:type VI secretion system secreted protein VgrG